MGLHRFGWVQHRFNAVLLIGLCFALVAAEPLLAQDDPTPVPGPEAAPAVPAVPNAPVDPAVPANLAIPANPIDYSQFTILQNWPITPAPLTACLSDDESRLLLGFGGGLARIIDLNTGKTITENRWFNTSVTFCTLNSDGTQALTGSSFGTVALWSLADPTKCTLYPASGFSVPGSDPVAAAFTDKNQIAITFHSANRVNYYLPLFGIDIYNAGSTAIDASFTNLVEAAVAHDQVLTLVLNNTGSFPSPATLTQHALPVDKNPKVLSTSTTPQAGYQYGSQQIARLMALSPNGTYCVISLGNGTLEHWNLTTTTKSLVPPRGMGYGVAAEMTYSRDSRQLLFTDLNNGLQIVQTATGATSSPVAPGLTSLCFDPRGEAVTGLGSDHLGTVLDVRTGPTYGQQRGRFGDLGAPNAPRIYPGQNSGRLVLVYADRVQIWGPNPTPLAKIRDPLFTAYLLRQGLDQSLLAAVINAPMADIAVLLKAHPDWLEQTDERGATPLLYACETGRLDVAAALLEAGADPLHADAGGHTPLWHAIWTRNLLLMDRLVAAGVTVDPNWGRLAGSLPPSRNFESRDDNRVALQVVPAGISDAELARWIFDHGGQWPAQAANRYLQDMDVASDPQLAQVIYRQTRPINTWLMLVLQVAMLGLGGLWWFRMRRQKRAAAKDLEARNQAAATAAAAAAAAAKAAEPQPVPAEAMPEPAPFERTSDFEPAPVAVVAAPPPERVQAYHQGSWGDDGAGELGLYPEEQRELAVLRQKSRLAEGAPLPGILAWLGVGVLGLVNGYWWQGQVMIPVGVALFFLGSIWVLNHLQNTDLRRLLHGAGIAAAFLLGLMAIGCGVFLQGIPDIALRAMFFICALIMLPMIPAYLQMLLVLRKVAKMEETASKARRREREEFMGDTGWDEKKDRF